MSERTEESLKARVRETPLIERLNESRKRIAAMCSERRGPKMTIPVEHYDDDFFICTTLEDARDEVARLKERKDGAYLERNQVVATLAKCFPSGIARTAIDGWDEEWHGCVYIDLPTGQVSWHYHDSHAHLFAGLPPYNRAWDGHSTEEKYQRLAALTPQAGKAGVNG